MRIWLLLTYVLAASGCSKEEQKAPPAPAPAPAAAAAPAPAATAPPAPAEPITPCSVFPQADAEQLLATPVDPAVSQEYGNGAILSCSYSTKEPATPPKAKSKAPPAPPPVLTVTLEVAARSRVTSAAEAVAKVAPGAPQTAVTVAGTQAVWVDSLDMLFAGASGWIVKTNATVPKAQRLALSQALMEKVLPRLPAAPL